jgi:hypothetical protein
MHLYEVRAVDELNVGFHPPVIHKSPCTWFLQMVLGERNRILVHGISSKSDCHCETLEEADHSNSISPHWSS